jgi:hypothetical protein
MMQKPALDARKRSEHLIEQTYKIIALYEQSISDFVSFDNQPPILIAAARNLQGAIDFLTLIERDHAARYGRQPPAPASTPWRVATVTK